MAAVDPVALGLSATPKRAHARAGTGAPEKAALALLIVITAISILAPLLAPHSTTQPAAAGPFHSPGHGTILGTDELGRDLLSRVLIGIRTSWFSALAVVASGILIGGAVGLVAGICGGAVDSGLMRVTDLFLALPGPVLAIAAALALGPSLLHALLAVAIVWWPWYARIVRGEVRSLMARPHLDAARIAGDRGVLLAVRHVIPGLAPPIIVTASMDIGSLILTLAGLSFLGLGAPPPSPELGAMTAEGLTYVLGQPWISLVPAAVVFILAFASNIAGDGIRDVMADR
ncbi:MAG: peptide/nickel transport system permease protein [Frankiales bacterium]|jgi:peptide/nickel transport system permease protein|nr:peptide/nickel transport system permease protein [Frankiales bacterium]